MQINLAYQSVPIGLQGQQYRDARSGNLSSGNGGSSFLNQDIIEPYISPKAERSGGDNFLHRVPDCKVLEDYVSSSTKTWDIPKQSPAGQSEYSSASSQDIRPPTPQLLKVADAEMVEKFLESCLVNLQQTACKLLAKILVKLIQPRKQTNHPYSGRSGTAPPWWPPLPQVGSLAEKQENRVRHVEPDHLSKAERIQLLLHILQIVVTPPQKRNIILENDVNVGLAREVANVSMSDWFNRSDENRSKQYFLDTMFMVAESVERYNNDEIDDTTVLTIPSQGEDMLSQNASHLQSDNKPFRGQVEVEEVELQHGLPILCDRCQNQMLCDRCHKPILCDRCHTPILRADTMQPPDFQLAPVNMYRHPYVPTFPTFPGDHKSDHFKEAAW